MTLCVAVKCVHSPDKHNFLNFQTRVAACCDLKISEDGIGSSETLSKRHFISDKWVGLFAGSSVSECRELLGLYEKVLLEKQDEIDTHNVIEILREPLRQFRRSIANTLTHAKLAMSFEEFLQRRGQSEISDDAYRSIIDAISTQQIGPELILIGSVAGDLEMFECGADVTACEHFAAIGSGRWIARAALFQRAFHHGCSQAEALYGSYEAKRLGEIAEGVGKKTEVMLFASEGGLTLDLANGREIEAVLKRQFSRFGPRKVRLEGYDFPEGCILESTLESSKPTSSAISQG
jgi:hypothetical protein